MATTADTTDTDQVPIMDPSRADAYGTVMLGYPLASYALVVDPRVSANAEEQHRNRVTVV
jgi:hypothetical protein